MQLPGGSNYAWYNLNGCDREPFGVIYNYHDANVASTVRSQLQAMYDHGQRRLRIPIYFCHGCTGGTVMDSSGGKLSAQHRTNLASFLADVKAKKFVEIMVGFFPQGANRPGKWATWNEAMFQENRNLVVDLRPIIAGAGIPYRIDLMNEGMPTPSQTQLREYARSLWAAYVAAYGKSDTVGFSIRPGSGPDELRSMIQQLPYVYDGNYPEVHSLHFYYQPRQSFEAAHDEMNKLGQAQGWIIGETFYNDASEANELKAAVTSTRRAVHYLTQWPITTSWGCADVDVAPPVDYDRYLGLSGDTGTATTRTPVIESAGSGCADGSCIWIKGTSFEANAHVDVRPVSSGTIIGTYRGADRALTEENGKGVITIRLDTDQEKTLFATEGLRVWVVNPSAGTWSSGTLVKQGAGGGATPTPTPTPTPAPGQTPTALTPVIESAGSGCPDGNCIWINGTSFEAGAYVDVRPVSSGTIIGTYRGADRELTRQNGKDTITIRLKTDQEETLFATEGLRVWVVNPTAGTWSSGVLVKR